MIILGIESSCDDTSIALVDCSENNFEILAEKTASQIDVHKKYGGVVPEIAGRKHAENIVPVLEEVMKGQPEPEVIAVTSGPGLMTGLLVGTEVAKTISYLKDIPIVGVNHIEGHIYSVLLGEETRDRRQETNILFPALCLIASGGHTELILMKDHGDYELIGKTRDDAVGEAFDKVAKLIGLTYPGGPKISKLGETGNTTSIRFPRPMLDDESFDMSFSGLKTAALYWLKENELSSKENFCASFEEAIVDVLVTKTTRAVKKYRPKSVILAGGVSANRRLRAMLLEAATPMSCRLLTPKTKYCMDNAAMIAVAGYFHSRNNDFIDWKNLEANPNWKIYAQ